MPTAQFFHIQWLVRGKRTIPMRRTGSLFSVPEREGREQAYRQRQRYDTIGLYGYDWVAVHHLLYNRF